MKDSLSKALKKDIWNFMFGQQHLDGFIYALYKLKLSPFPHKYIDKP